MIGKKELIAFYHENRNGIPYVGKPVRFRDLTGTQLWLLCHLLALQNASRFGDPEELAVALRRVQAEPMPDQMLKFLVDFDVDSLTTYARLIKRSLYVLLALYATTVMKDIDDYYIGLCPDDDSIVIGTISDEDDDLVFPEWEIQTNIVSGSKAVN